MAIIIIDGREYTVSEGRNLLQAALDHGLNLPYFCWHPAMTSVGACRLCAVKQFKDADDRQGRIVMSCMTPAADGTIISIEDPDAAAFRRRMIELLMINHPHDCPVCDEGGECHLQDMTVMCGHAYRTFRARKRTFRNQDLGPGIHHEMNRCIECYRCVRFYREFAGGEDLGAFGIQQFVYFGRTADGTLASPFSGNLVDVCPTGVFTDRTLRRHYARKWDLVSVPSVCVHCGAGCNIIPAGRDGRLLRVTPRYHGEVNGYFICDRARFGYEFVSTADRPRAPRHRELGEIGWDVARHMLAEAAGREKLAVIGSPRATVEVNALARRVAGDAPFSPGLDEAELRAVRAVLEAASAKQVRLAPLRELERADALLVLGADPLHESPMAALAIRQAVRAGARLFVAAPWGTWLDRGAEAVLRGRPSRLGEAGSAIAAALAEGGADPGGPDGELAAFSRAAAGALGGAERPAVVTGTALGLPELTAAAAAVAAAAGAARGAACGLFVCLAEPNTMGAALLGGESVESIMRRVDDGEVEHLLVVENDILSRGDVPGRFGSSLDRLSSLTVLDHATHATADRALLAVPVQTFERTSGIVVSGEGRAQRLFPLFPPAGDVREAADELAEMARAAGRDVPADGDALRSLIASEHPLLAGIDSVSPPAGFRVHGLPVARASHRESGRTARPGLQDRARMHPKPPPEPRAPFVDSDGGARMDVPSSLTARFWTPGWNSGEALNKFQIEVGGGLHGGDPGRRLIEPGGGDAPAASGAVPDAAGEGDLLLLVRPQVFGGEPLSGRAPVIAARAPAPVVSVSPADAERLGLSAGDRVRVSHEFAAADLELAVDETLPQGLATCPAGAPGTDGLGRRPRMAALNRLEPGEEPR
jgi:NADH-quinone oxidoreductase subunit G